MDGLKFLLNAPSQKTVEEIFLLGFKRRNEILTEKEKKALVDLLQIKDEEALNVMKNVILQFVLSFVVSHVLFYWKLFQAVSFVVREAVYEGMNAEQIIDFLPKDLHEKLKVLISKIVVHHLPKWRELATTTQVCDIKIIDQLLNFNF
jgi:hypothetical protein